MTNSSIIVWPRHEIIQLINPSLSQSGRHLTNSLIVEASRHLAKLQSLDNSLRFIFYIFLYSLYFIILIDYLVLIYVIVLNNGILLQVIS